MNPTTAHGFARSVRRFTFTRLALLGYVPFDFPPRAVRKAVGNCLAGTRTPIHIEFPHGITVRMARHTGALAADAHNYPSRGYRRRLVKLSAVYAIAIYRQIAAGGRVADGTADALLDVLRYVNETVLRRVPCEQWLADAYRPAALAGLTDPNVDRGARTLAAALRGMYRIRTLRDFVAERRWVLAAATLALTVGGCVAAGR